MSLPVVLALGVAGGFGAIARFLVDGSIAARARIAFPLGTFAVNLTGAFVLGVLVGATVRSDSYRIAGTGFLGAYTTFSTWVFESHRLGEDGQVRIGAVNFVVGLVLGIAVAWLGREFGMAL